MYINIVTKLLSLVLAININNCIRVTEYLKRHLYSDKQPVMKKIIYTLILSLFVSTTFAQWAFFQESEWLGQVADVIETSDSGFATVGWTSSTPTVVVTKLNSSGSEQWATTIEHPGFNDYAHTILESADGGLVVAGYESYWSRPFAAKLDADGSLIWTTEAWADTMTSDFYSGRGALLADGNLALIGGSLYDASFVVHIVDGTDGSLISTHPGDSIDGGYFFFTSISDITATDDGGFAITGQCFDGAFEQVYFICKYDDAGEREWSSTYATTDAALGNGIDATDDGGFLVTGQNDNSVFLPTSESFIAKHSSDGTQEWINYYVTGMEYPSGFDVAERTDGSIVMVEGGGNIIFPDLTEEANVLYLDSEGTLIDDVRIGEISVVSMFRLIATTDGGFITGGLVAEDSITMETNFTALIKSGADGSLPDCMFNCVWPGDADNNGVADMDDILIIGVVAGSTGPARDDTSIEWYAHAAEAWGDSILGLSDYKYADCNGDGIINDDDTTAVSLNYGFEHDVFELRTAEGEVAMSIVTPDEALLPGPFSLPVTLGTATDYPEAIYGVRFSITYEGDALEASSMSFNFGDNWFGSAENEIRFRKNNTDLMQLDVVLVRKDQNNTSGYGEIGELSGIVIDNIAGRGRSESILFSITNIRAIDVDMNEISVEGETAEVETETTGIEDLQNNMVQIFPNPASGNQLNLITKGNIVPELVIITDMTGGIVEQENPTGARHIDISEIPAGAYLVTVIWNGGSAVQTIIRQ